MEVVELDQRRHGLTSTDEIGTAPARKGSRLLTNTQAAPVVLSKCCNVAKVTQKHPKRFCHVIFETLRLQQDDCDGVGFLGDEDGLCGGFGKDENLVMKDESLEEMDMFEPQWVDDRTGEPLEKGKVSEGRAKEYEKLMQRGVPACLAHEGQRVSERKENPYQVGRHQERRGREMPVRWSGVRCWGPKD